MNDPSTRGSTNRASFGIHALLFGAFGLFGLATLVYWLPKDIRGTGIDDWLYTDWLIDYSAGFVRRGLTGELVRLLSHLAPPTAVVALLTWGLFCAVAITYLRWVWRSLDKLSPLLVFGLLFLPSLLPFYLHDHGALGRKEMIGFLILAWHLHLLTRLEPGDSSSYVKRLLPLSAFALPVHLFIHEASFFQFLPVHLLISEAMIRRDAAVSFPRRMLTLALVYSPAFLSCLVVARFGRPTFDAAWALCRHWEALGALPAGSSNITGKDPTWALPGALTCLPWSFSQAASMSQALPHRVLFYWAWLGAVLGFFTVWIGSMVTVALTNSQGPRRLDLRAFTAAPAPRLWGKYFLLPALASLPLYVLGWDFGRWFAVTCLNYIFIALSPEVLAAERSFAHPPAPPPAREAAPVAPVWVFYAQLAALLLVVCFLRLPRYNNEGANMFVWPFDSLFVKLFSLLHH